MLAIRAAAIALAAAGPWDGRAEAELSAHHRAVAHWGMAMYETAARELAALPGLAPARVNLAMVRLTQKRFEDALAALESAPESERSRYMRGRCLLGLARASEAAEQFRKVPGEPAARFRLSEAYLTMGRQREAEEELRKVLSLRPDHGAALNRLGRLLEARGERKEAEGLLRRFAMIPKLRQKRAQWCPYDEPWEPEPSGYPPAAGGHWLSVRAAGVSPGEAVVTVEAGALVLRKKAGRAPVRFELGSKDKVDAVRVDWPDFAHSYRLDPKADGALVIEEVSTHVW